MTYAAIMVHVEPLPEAEPRLRLAVDIANRFDAALIGVGAEALYPIVIGGFGETIVVAGQEAVEANLKTSEALFRTAAKNLVKAGEWRATVDFPEMTLAREARAADLIVAGPHRESGLGFYGAADPGELLMQAGVPILLAPAHQTVLDAGRVIIGWKDTRECRRAVRDSLPFLKRAASVLVVETCEDDRDEAAVRRRLEDVAAWLLRHGVEGSVAVRPLPPHDAAEDLVQLAQNHGANLMVVGGYGHSRLREWMFGGVTRRFLADPPCAILFGR